jgi:hypothetical protein
MRLWHCNAIMLMHEFVYNEEVASLGRARGGWSMAHCGSEGS